MPTASRPRQSRRHTVAVLRFLWYAATSFGATVLDMALYMAVLTYVFAGGRAGWMIVVATVVARIVSSLVNFVLKKRTVFDDRSHPLQPLIRYAILALVVMAASALGTATLSALSGGRALASKAVVDGLLFFVNYLGHKHWVFRGDAGVAEQDKPVTG